MSYSDWAITLVIIVVVIVAAMRAGQRNPVGTGRLARRLGELELRVGEQGRRLDGIELSVAAISKTLGETNAGIQALRLEVAGDRGLTERTWSAVDRLQNYFIEQSFKGRGQ